MVWVQKVGFFRYFPLLFALFAGAGQGATVLVLQFHNESQYSDLNWVGESIAETLRVELSANHQIALSRDSRAEGLRRLGLRPDAQFTKATLIKLGHSLDVDYVCYGTYGLMLPPGDTELRNSSVQIAGRFIDLRKMHDGPQVSETGKLTDLSRLQEHLAWQSLKFLEPGANFPLEQFMTFQKFIRLDAEESYIRGLLSSRGEQQKKWFTQAHIIDSHFVGPIFELGKLAYEQKDYRQAVTWFGRIPASDSRYTDARFRMGLSAYNASDYTGAANYFREVAKTVPLNEVYNNLGAAEEQLGLSSAVIDLRKAAEGDPNDMIYRFNLGVALLRTNSFDEATNLLQAVVDHDADDAQARTLLDRARRREFSPANARPLAPARLKQNFDETAFRQLKAMLQPKGSA
ncbi:MAG: tetratricopeptide repeat protein [Bryobacteraceae bacterium]